MTTISNTADSQSVLAVRNSAAASSAASDAGTTSSSTLGSQNQFLQLLMTQMRNQDPLNPMDNAQVTSQLAQISTVNGIQQLNTTLQSLTSNMMANESLQAAYTIGHDVLVPGNSLQLGTGGANFGVELPQGVDQLSVTINDAAGRALKTLDLGAQSAGDVALNWDGTTTSGSAAAPGSYSFTVKASQGGQAVSATALTVGQVTSVSNGSQGVKLNVTGLGTVGLQDVKQIF
jgi:flagellar basal-body rod modification protein FlgD